MNFISSNSENLPIEIAAATPKLPNDVVIEILTRLPVKPLLKFRCVCKSWLSIISSHPFIKTHLTNSKNDPNFTHHRIMLNCRGNLKQCSARSLLYEPIIESFHTGFSSQSSKNSIWVVGSCDGLICLAIDKKELILWNPTTRISKNLPDFGVKISFRSYFAYGFGFDKSSDDYKGKVYSLKADLWKTIKSFKGRWLMDDPATFANGKLYWIANSDLELKCGWDIAFFDLATDEYGVLEMPRYVKSGFYSRLGVSQGRLFVMCSHVMSADVWIMDGGGAGNGIWSNVVSIPYVDDFLRYNYKKALCVTENGEVVLICGLKIVIFDADDSSFRYPEIRNAGEFIASSAYIESLVSPLGR
ncbi:F-box/kelch-repeat protein at3g23880 [Phtheirospermum japonicum]|uniref:F-box/kelch-repeat protein at3g23880 n=1 Tax=Phtheirospermum japonicum TaxID=374723 RepID=A0A830CUV0_9LAMI|nr:F-box/kelch-repeat protein at3g23880 [Phtheirospermum japonicum]